MIIDSHAHYNNNAYKKLFRYLTYDKDGYSIKEGSRERITIFQLPCYEV